MKLKNISRSIIVIGLTFTLMLGMFTDNVMAASKIDFTNSSIQELNTSSVQEKITKSTFKSLPSLQLGDGAINGAEDSVLFLQKLLFGLGRIEKDAVTGIFSATTEEAVKAYQKDKGIEQDGKVGKDTWSKLGYDHSH
jgi:peptidoglycan hydrolase-like protein with peptidoglycan-binding domain